jgi:hypothetical protein
MHDLLHVGHCNRSLMTCCHGCTAAAAVSAYLSVAPHSNDTTCHTSRAMRALSPHLRSEGSGSGGTGGVRAVKTSALCSVRGQACGVPAPDTPPGSNSPSWQCSPPAPLKSATCPGTCRVTKPIRCLPHTVPYGCVAGHDPTAGPAKGRM